MRRVCRAFFLHVFRSFLLFFCLSVVLFVLASFVRLFRFCFRVLCFINLCRLRSSFCVVFFLSCLSSLVAGPWNYSTRGQNRAHSAYPYKGQTYHCCRISYNVTSGKRSRTCWNWPCKRASLSSFVLVVWTLVPKAKLGMKGDLQC